MTERFIYRFPTEIARKPLISPVEMEIALSAISILANGNPGSIEASYLIKRVVDPKIIFEFTDKITPDGIVFDAVRDVVGVFWGQNATRNEMEQKLINDLRLLKKRGLNRKHIMEMLKSAQTFPSRV